ncbi:MAG: DNA-binding protein WhiA [Oscillospiraceae bacterium]|nr:DNA-binding protein WhiA [Oscillospiraceae bacterium]
MSYSYSYNTKIELCKLPCERDCCAAAEAYGMLLFANTFSRREIRIITGNKSLGKRIIDVFMMAFKTSFDTMPDEEHIGKQPYLISRPEKISRIFEAYGFSKDNMLAHNVNLGMLEDDCCRTSFVRGAFLTGGAVTDPEKRYHLEIVTPHYNVSRQTFSLLLDMALTPKEASRSGNYIIYFKQSSAIEDFLTLIGAPVHAMKLMSAKIEKDMINTVTRKINCDNANLDKIVDAADAQIKAIKQIMAAGAFEKLTERLKETARLRLDNPSLSISELAAISVPAVTKSCMNHRMRKFVEIALTFDGL